MSNTPEVTRKGRLARRYEDQAQAFRAVGWMLAVMWVVEIVNAIDSYKLDPSLGIKPRDPGRLFDILLAPFLHASFSHILGNTIPFAILGLVIAASGLRRLAVVTVISILISGAGVWLLASSNSYTVGASGIVFGFAAYLVARGIFDHRIRDLVIGAVVGVVFGISLLSDLIPRSGVSWQAHLFGAVGGVLAAAVLAEKHKQDQKQSAPSHALDPVL